MRWAFNVTTAMTLGALAGCSADSKAAPGHADDLSPRRMVLTYQLPPLRPTIKPPYITYFLNGRRIGSDGAGFDHLLRIVAAAPEGSVFVDPDPPSMAIQDQGDEFWWYAPYLGRKMELVRVLYEHRLQLENYAGVRWSGQDLLEIAPDHGYDPAGPPRTTR